MFRIVALAAMGSGFALLASLWAGESSTSPTAAAPVDFDKQIAPILGQNCLQCHNGSQAEGHLNLSTAATALAGGDSGPVIAPGDTSSSYFLDRVREHEMPPKGKGKPLSDTDVATLTAWIAAGAKWPEGKTISELDFTTERRAGRDWWSFQSPRRPGLPPAASEAGRNAIDRFIRAELAVRQLTPSPEADRPTLARRLSFDLCGLPPTPEETQAFVGDASPDAYERMADRLLASPRYGERWARHWLDVVRFGETNGYETNTPRGNAWPYRDYVIQSLSEDKPYNQFVTEQLVGDQTGAGAATAFLVGGPKDEVGINTVEGQRQQRLDDLDDMIATTGSAFLGLTLNCAKCHNHKFDPVAQADYYRFAAIFAGVNHGDRPVPSLDYQRRLHQVPELLARAQRIDKRLGELDRMIDSIGEPLASIDRTSTTPQPRANALLRPAVNSQYNVDRFEPIKARYIRFTIQSAQLYEPCIDELEIFTAGDEPRNVALASAGAKATASGVYSNGQLPIHQIAHLNDGRYGNSYSWISNEAGRGWVQIELPEEKLIDRVVWARDRELKFRDRVATAYRIEVAVEPDKWTTVATHADRRTFDPNATVRGRNADRLPAAQATEYRELVSAKTDVNNLLPKATITVYAGNFAAMPGPTYRLNRGDVMQPQEEIQPGSIAAIAGGFALPPNTPDIERRRKLAEWLTNPRHPLTTRVIVNRLWHYHFGQGLMSTPSNFGFLGGVPSHPALLDWLATEMVERDWSLKAMHRLMVTSATWRQASADNPQGRAADAQCRLLWRYPPRRLEAEPIRDAMLMICGTLDLRMGGAGYSVFEANDNYVRVYTPKKQFGPAEWRRMIYQTKPRMQQDATFGEFDCPDASSTMPKRNVSTTALQALNLFNSEFTVQQAGYFAARLRHDAGQEPAAQVRRAFELAFGRTPDEDEAAGAAQLVKTHGLEALCRAMLNASELLYVN